MPRYILEWRTNRNPWRRSSISPITAPDINTAAQLLIEKKWGLLTDTLYRIRPEVEEPIYLSYEAKPQPKEWTIIPNPDTEAQR